MAERLSNPDALSVEEKKIVDYLLNHNHEAGKSKAKYFSAFGFDKDSWQILADALLEHGRERDIDESEDTGFGTKYVLRCNLATPDERNPCIKTVWISEGDGRTRLVTAYPA